MTVSPSSPPANEVVIAKLTIPAAQAVLAEKFIVVKVAIAHAEPALAESVFVIEVAESPVPSVARDENTIAKADAISEWSTAVQASITGVVAIYEYSALPTLVVTQSATSASTLRHRHSRQRHQQKCARQYEHNVAISFYHFHNLPPKDRWKFSIETRLCPDEFSLPTTSMPPTQVFFVSAFQISTKT